MTWLRTGRRWVPAAMVAAYTVLAAVALSLLVWSGLSTHQQEVLIEVLSPHAPVLLVGGALVLAGLVSLVARLLSRYTSAARRLSAETRLLLEANPDHRVDRSGPSEIQELATAVDALAERRRVAEREVATQIASAQMGLEQERNRLATLMAELAVAVLVCNVDGHILLYNAAARSLLDDTAVGLGRSIFHIVDRDLLEHAVARIQAASTSSHMTTTLHGGRLLQVQVATVHGQEREVTGYVLLLEDLTERLAASGRHDDLLREFTEATRASLGSIQAAIETVTDYPDMGAEDRQQFVGIVREESQRLGNQVEGWAAESVSHLATDWLLGEMRGNDLLSVVADAITRIDGVTVTVRAPEDALWVKADSHALARSASHLVGRLREQVDIEAVTLAITRASGHAQLEVTWSGQAPPSEDFQAWLDQPLPGGAVPNVREVVARHGGEVWSAATSGDAAHLVLLLPLTDAARTPAAQPRIDVASRPEYYDFGLFDRQEESLAWHDRRLSELAYTVFDTETTGLQPTQGDEIISVGAVRVVNGRLLRQEAFERLVDPRRSVPAASTAVHGLTRKMLTGQPTLETVLPEFARYASDTVLVGHNVGFDMQFLRLQEAHTGVRFTQPVLDTLLLDAALHPDHEEHSLESIAARLGVDVVKRHTALGDALVTGEVFLRLLLLFQQQGALTLGEILEASRTTAQARLDRSMYDT